MKNKNIQVILAGILLVLTLFAYGYKKNQIFALEEKYYGINLLEEINLEKLKELRESKESFGVFVYQPLCSNSDDFEIVLKEFQKENKIKFYKISFSSILESDLKETVKYYPSFLIFKEGKLIDHLEADKDKYTEYYRSKEGFKSWFTTYVELKQIEEKPKVIENIEEKYLKEIDLKSIKKESGKINVYLFWGNGCPHCAEELSYLETIPEEIKQKMNLIPLEIWKNEENSKLLKVFAEAMGETVTGVPYTIIGKKSFKGYGGDLGKTLEETIEEQLKENYDIYFDKIKKEKAE